MAKRKGVLKRVGRWALGALLGCGVLVTALLLGLRTSFVREQVRLALRRQLCHEVARDGLIEVVLLSPELEDLLRGALRQTSQGSCLELEPDVERTIFDGLAALASGGGGGAAVPVLLAAADLRRALRKLIEKLEGKKFD